MKRNIVKLSLVAIASTVLSFSTLAADSSPSIKSYLDGTVTVGDDFSKTEVQRTSSSPVDGIFTLSYPYWINISGTCQKLIFLVTSGKGYNQLYHTRVEAWGSTPSRTPYANSNTWVTHSVISSVSCDSYAPGIEY